MVCDGALGAGLLLGLALRWIGPIGPEVAAQLKPLGELWLNSLRVTLVPLVFCLMTVGVAKVTEAAGRGGS